MSKESVIIMKSIDVYEQYFEADYVYNGVQRNAVVVKLTAISEEGNISYVNSLSFFPHSDPEDYGISYDAYFEKTIYSAKGRRSKKKDAEYLAMIRDLSAEICPPEAKIYWDKALIEARLG